MLINPDTSDAQNISLEAETGLVWFSRNDVRIPNEGGTDFNMLDLIGTGAVPYYRVSIYISIGERNTIRALMAPLRKIGTGSFDDDILFENTRFQAGVPVDGIYRFNTYRFTYRFTFYNRNKWVLGVGAAALIRDAKIELIQADRSDKNTDLGFVPLLHIYAERGFGNRFSLILDAETLAGPQGRATDASLAFNTRFSDRWSLRLGYRILEGGADVDEVYNFSWINFGMASLRVQF